MKPHGEQRVANLLKLQEIARAMAEAEVGLLQRARPRLGEMESSRQAESKVPRRGRREFRPGHDVSQGEGIGVPGRRPGAPRQRSRDRKNALLDRARGRLHLNLGHRKTRGWDAAMAEEEDRAEHERRRLFYVALTRARDLLVIPAYWARNPQAEFLKYLGERYAPGAAEKPAWSPSRRTVSTSTSAAATRCGSSRRRRPRCRRRRSIAHHEKWKAAVKARAEQLSAGQKIQTASGSILRNDEREIRIDDSSSHADQALTPQSEGRAAALGSLVHQLMEIVDLRSPGDLTLPPRPKRAGSG